VHAECPGVVINGAIINGILTGEMWRTAPDWLTAALTIFLGIAAIGFLIRFHPFPAMLLTAVAVVSYLLINGLLLFDLSNLIVPAAPPALAATSAWALITLSGFVGEIARRRWITNRFKAYVDPTLVDYVLAHPERDRLEAARREVTVVFTDLGGFTTLTEQLGEGIIPLLSDYWSKMIPLIRKHRGMVNKLLGDGIMFTFNAPEDNPNHASDAIHAIREMQAAMGPLNESLTKKGLPILSMRAGVSTGNVIVGDAGPKEVTEYTFIGDIVNTAARLEPANKSTGTTHLVTERTAELAREHFLFRPIAKLRVVGKSKSTMTYEACCRSDDADDRQRRLISLTGAMVDAFVRSEFEKCMAAAHELERAAGVSTLSQLYLERATYLSSHPPDPGFAGEFELHSK
jgi:adenylate cyclase